MSALRAMIAAETRQPVFGAAQAFADHLHNTYGVSVAAIVFYGSCLRHETDRGLLLDFYVLVDSLGAAVKNPISAVLGTLLPPNVYYHEMSFEDRTVRAKVAVMSMSRFMRDTSPDCFASSTWARFSQPARILYVRHDGIRARVINALTQAVETMIVRTMPLLPVRFTARDLWVNALTATYGAELRPESTSKAAELVDAELARYIAVTERVVGQTTSDATYMNAMFDKQNAARRTWAFRRIQGKVLNVLRLIKAAFTFQGGLDYAVWKIERHSGVTIALTARDRKWPLLTGLRLLPMMLKRGGIK
jgi:hypothetical protein